MLMMFVETGLLIALVIPGGATLLVTAGLLSGSGILRISLPLLIGSLAVACLAGDFFGYYLGRKLGKKLHNRPDSWYFKRKHLENAQQFYQQHGPSALIIGHFIPVVRTFNPLLAGVSHLPLNKHLTLSALGSFLWVGGLVGLSYLAAMHIPQLREHLFLIVTGVAVASSIPALLQYFRQKKA